MSASPHKPNLDMKNKTGNFLLMFLPVAGLLFLFSSCQTVKPYQRMYLNDDAMQMKKRPVENLSSRMHTYREGASGGGRGKSSGGCGCN
jgi:hypothetical protein